MNNDIQTNANKITTSSNSINVPLIEIKPKIQFGVIEIAPIIMVILTAIIGYVVQVLWHKRQNFIKASDEFRAVFDVTIHALETIPFCDRDVLDGNFQTHEKAMIKFRDNLKGNRLTSFNQDWEEYKQYCLSRVDVPLLFFIATEVSNLDNPNDSGEIDIKHRQKALEHIKKLLSYTKR